MEFKKFFTLIKFNQTLLALPFAYLGLLFAGGGDIFTWIWITIAFASARTAGISFDMVIDIYIDTEKKDRLIPSEQASKAMVWFISIISSVILVCCSYMLNELCFYLSFAAILLLFTYSYFKNVSPSSHYYLGLVEAAAPIGGYLAETGRFEYIPFILGTAVFMWLAGLDIIFAVQDTDYNKKENLFSIPARFGIGKILVISSLLYLLALSTLIAAGMLTGRGLPYWVSLVCVAIIFIRQQFLARSDDIKAAIIELFQINSFVSSILFVGTYIDVMLI